MADYHPLISRAVAGLDKNTGDNRRALYERARTALVAQLRGVVPALDESEITRERLALEEAIRKVEAESARHAREMARPTFIKRLETPKQAEPPHQTESQAAQPRTAPNPPRDGAAATTTFSRGPGAPGSQRFTTAPNPSPSMRAPPSPGLSAPQGPASSPVQERRSGDRRQSLSDEGLKGFRDVVTDPSAVAEARKSGRYDYDTQPEPGLPPAAPFPPPERHPLQEYGQLEPQLQPENNWAPQSDGTQQNPPADFEDPRRQPARQYPQEAPAESPLSRRRQQPRSYGRAIRIGLVFVLIVAVGGLLYWQRSTIAGIPGSIMALMRSPSPTPPREAAAPSRPKIPDRIGQPGTQSSPGVAVAQRVALYEEDPNDPQGKSFSGTVIWRTETRPAAPGRPPELVVRADVEVPDRNLSVTWSLRRNTDQSLPASHTIEVMFNQTNESQSGGIQNVPGVLMKQSEQTRGVPLAGLSVKVTPGFFLIGLSALDADMQRNLQLLKERAWFDIPVVYGNNRRAILAVEKGTPGERAFAEAFTAWRQ